MAVQAQPYSETLVGLSHCGLQQDWMDFGANGGGGFCEFYPSTVQVQQQQQQSNHQMVMQNQWMMRNQNLGQVADSSENVSLGVQLEKQRREIDWFIYIQNERLRSALQQQRKQQLYVLLNQLESKALNLLRQKDADIAKAARKTMELEECIRRAEMENQGWQRVAMENELMVETLNNTLQQARENACVFTSEAEDAESCCQSRTEEDEGEEQQSTQAMKMVCKVCNSGNLCVLFLPCRHLCCCKTCEPFLGFCPVCQSVKKAYIEVFTA